ncbi:hypothetical protein [Gimesia chilikensis]|uniref:hypothetical protein n=1 Tax=Gimesia chilikensis TaxID=2605989 RepID=UPI0018D9E9CA|nr:hypothetical protein [Gimesia chilikensis]
MPWFDWIEFLINHRRAVRLVTGREPEMMPRLVEQEQRARAAIEAAELKSR